MPRQPNGSLLRFGVFDLDHQMGVLRKNGRALKLQPQPARVLALLVTHPNELITREDLREKIWGNSNYGDFDHALNVCISQLRDVLDDNAESPRWIETVPRRGYRFLAPVEEIGPVRGPASIKAGQLGLPTHQSRGVPPKRKTQQWSAVFLVSLAFCFAAGYLLGKRKTPTVSPPSFTRLTYERGIVFSARFAPDGRVVYDASWDNRPIRIFSTSAALSQPMALDLSAHLLGVSATGELAITLNGYAEAYPVFLRGTLSRAPMAGGAPRELLEDVRWADWDRQGNLAVVRHWNGRSRLEYPVGKVLYENAGWISHIRVSPSNDRIAFVDHPVWSEDRGSIAVVDLRSGEEKVLSKGWESAMGLAWASSGDEIWFTAAKAGERRDLLAVDLRAHQRTVLQVPGGVTLHDISRDGRVLLTVDNERIGIMALTPHGERDLSWSHIGFPRAISPDGEQVLLNNQSEQAGSDYWVGLRTLDGSPPVHLGEGWGGGFSPDGRWTVTTVASRPESSFLLPVGVGERKELKHPGIRTYSYPSWFMPDGQGVLIAGIESGHLPRSYVQSIHGGPPRPVTPEGTLGRSPSPDGRYLVVQQVDQTHVLYDIQRGESRAIPGDTWQLWPAGWSPDSRYLYMYTRTGPPSRIWRYEIGNAQKKLVKELSPTDPAGILEIFHVQMTPDAKTFAYAYDRYLSELYVVNGLR